MAVKIGYTVHARKRLRERQIPENWASETIDHGDRYRDTQSGYEVTVSRRHYQGKERDMMVIFDRSGDNVTIVSIRCLRRAKGRAGYEQGGGFLGD